jgi:DNA-binding transcriptional MerR regulator
MSRSILWIVMVAKRTWKLDELAREAGVSPRTVRYYVQRGLLAAPEFRGRDTAYDEEHLLRLRAIKQLQDRFLPLDAIQAELDKAPPDELRAIAAGAAPRNKIAPPSYRGVAPPPVGPYRFPGYCEPIESPGSWTPRERVTKARIAPGLEITLDEAADAEVRMLFDDLIAVCERRGFGGKR